MAIEDYLLERIVEEAAPLLIGEKAGRVFEPGQFEFAINFRRGATLYCSLIPSRPGLFFTSRSFKSLEIERGASHFANLLRKYIADASVSKFEKERGERRVLLSFAGYSASGEPLTVDLLIELTGRSANAHLFVLNSYIASLREQPESSPQPSLTQSPRNGETKLSPTLARELSERELKTPAPEAYRSLMNDLCERKSSPRIYAPAKLGAIKPGEIDPRKNLILTCIDLAVASNLIENRFNSLNEAADIYFAILERIDAFKSRRNRLAAKIKADISRLETIKKRLGEEMLEFGRADELRRKGDLTLANIATLRREENRIFLIDYFDPDQKEISIEIDKNESPQQAAERFFKSYQRARRGVQAASKRLEVIEKDLTRARRISESISNAAVEEDLDKIESILFPIKEPKGKKSAKKTKSSGGGFRRYLSSDGYEILVGRSDAGNEEITFRIAKPSDIWLHAADYPGPHVLIRNPERREVPQKTVMEAAQLAAFFSKARNEKSAAVRYCDRKHVTRPKKAKPGLVLLTQFKTVMVQPAEAGSRLF